MQFLFSDYQYANWAYTVWLSFWAINIIKPAGIQACEGLPLANENLRKCINQFP